jgi:hypothetical protein
MDMHDRIHDSLANRGKIIVREPDTILKLVAGSQIYLCWRAIVADLNRKFNVPAAGQYQLNVFGLEFDGIESGSIQDDLL